MARLVTRPSGSALRQLCILAAPVGALALSACASNPTHATGSSGSASGSNGGGSGNGSGGSSSGGSSSGGSSSGGSSSGGGSSGSGGSSSGGFETDGGVINCLPAAPLSGVSTTLPLAIDSVFHPTGWMGDAYDHPQMAADPNTGAMAENERTPRMTISPIGYNTGNNDACTPDLGDGGTGTGRSSLSAEGTCWKIVYTPFPQFCTPYGWAGAFWQYPNNNWGAGSAANNSSGGNGVVQAGGYPVPVNPNNGGATQISFWARGSVGGESVKFFSGEGQNFPCNDFAAGASTPVTLTNAWAHYTIDLTGLTYGPQSPLPTQPNNYFGGVLGAFGFGVGDQTLGTSTGSASENDAGCPSPTSQYTGTSLTVAGGTFYYPTITFYIDDIEWQSQ